MKNKIVEIEVHFVPEGGYKAHYLAFQQEDEDGIEDTIYAPTAEEVFSQAIAKVNAYV